MIEPGRLLAGGARAPHPNETPLRRTAESETMQAKIIEPTQAFDRSDEEKGPRRIILARGATVTDKGNDKPNKDDPGKSVHKIPQSEIFALCDAKRALPMTREDLAIYQRRGAKPQTVAEQE